jgi:hypothetical protein
VFRFRFVNSVTSYGVFSDCSVNLVKTVMVNLEYVARCDSRTKVVSFPAGLHRLEIRFQMKMETLHWLK